jgi:hypothetical protein
MPDTADIDVHEMTEDDLRAVTEQALDEAGLTMVEIRARPNSDDSSPRRLATPGSY